MIKLKTWVLIALLCAVGSSCKKVDPESPYVGKWIGRDYGCYDILYITQGSNGSYTVTGNSGECDPGERFEGTFKASKGCLMIGNKRFDIEESAEPCDTMVYFLWDTVHATMKMVLNKPFLYRHKVNETFYKVDN